jgi:hypothetical protein
LAIEAAAALDGGHEVTEFVGDEPRGTLHLVEGVGLLLLTGRGLEHPLLQQLHAGATKPACTHARTHARRTHTQTRTHTQRQTDRERENHTHTHTTPHDTTRHATIPHGGVRAR